MPDAAPVTMAVFSIIVTTELHRTSSFHRKAGMTELLNTERLTEHDFADELRTRVKISPGDERESSQSFPLLRSGSFQDVP